MKQVYRILPFLLFIFIAPLSAQQMLEKQEAVQLVLENNFGVKIAKNSLEISENNQSLLNSGFLPSLTGNGGATYDKSNQEATFQDGNVRSIDGAETTRYNASLNLNYTLFDGLGRWYDYKRLKEEYNLTELQARETIENSIIQLFSVYYEVARITENIRVLEETYQSTEKRLKRAQYSFEFGQSNKLDVLNAEVDLVNDSINLMNERQLLKNTIRDLNIVLNQELENTYTVDTTVAFTDVLVLEDFLKTAEENNVRLLQAEKNIAINDYTLKASKSVFLPTIGLTGSYGWNEGNFPATNFLASNNSTGISGGVNLTWNLFDGGRGITQVKNAKILLESQELMKDQIRQEVKRDIANARGNYLNRLEVYRLQEQNVKTATDNFLRSSERYKLGQISSVELRQAQLNLLNSKTSKNQAKYNAKLAELQLLQLTGQLLNVQI
ncbi:MAG: TolC family protein [Muricauda sp.]|uniref:Transporter n=1 Tax=Flagellimonas lutaonensis TaxID=516051 RepID=A0A0D5YRV9_9FLAO|nr:MULTISPECIES: TolC family protein [Allomuricauda]AKA34591.1 transporter [Allomuricauda lutaonensis]MBC30611.1 TolC family protein [Allomuricauda sp.]|tara:strand:+ start:1151 stop:2470 length:1320 start_codon:yes stop_codon:yes gene_type:complete